LKNDAQKIAVIQVLIDEMDKIPAADMVKVGTLYPQLANVVQGDGAQNLKAVINDYAKKLKGQEYNYEEAKQRLQTLLNAIKDGYVKAQKPK
jgi:signal transduction histidine kinase